jgi:glycosyltransferase involved in cell wall biosynthesis
MFSVIIPTFNEEKYLGRLLSSIKKQKLQPDEIIVADNHSKDKTREVAHKYGCVVVDGGNPAQGRNHGAEKATREILVFLDADTELDDPDIFNKVIGTFIHKDADVASCLAKNIEDESVLPSTSHIVFNTTKRINQLTTKVLNTVVGELGFSIIVKRDFFNEIGGFNEGKEMTEDSEFFKRALEHGARYYVIPTYISVSDRRFNKRSPGNTVKLAVLSTLVMAGMFFGWKKLQQYSDKYEKIKGPLGGEIENDEEDDLQDVT